MSETFTARVVTGLHIGKRIGIPTINLDIANIPSDLEHGIYAAWARMDEGVSLPASMHFGPRPVFDAPISCEIHILEGKVSNTPQMAEVRVMGYIRPIQNFDSPALLVEQIHRDNAEARAILGLS